jgi:enediyne biosynthesis protein E4
MGTVLISLISNFFLRALFGALILFLLNACAYVKKNLYLPSDKELQTSLDGISQEAIAPVNYGPTLLSGENRFIDKTKDYGLEGVEGISFAMIDLNRDYIPDLVVVPNYFSEPRFFIFDSKTKKFSEAKYSPFPESIRVSFMLFADFNNDKVSDAVIGVLNQKGEFSKVPVSMWKGYYEKDNLLRFKRDVTFPDLPPEPTSSIIALDVNLDGLLDIFIGNWFHEHKKNLLPTADRLIMNRGDRWVDESTKLEGETRKTSDELYPPLAKPTYGASSCDIDQDGWPDILTASASGHYNKLWMNRPELTKSDRKFEDVGKVSGFAADPNGILVPTSGGKTFSATCSDYNDDGVMDIFVGELTHGWDNLSVDRSSVLTGNKVTYPPSFLRTEYMSDTVEENWNQGDKRSMWADLNLDGYVDIVVDNSGFPPHSRLVVFAQDETRAFINVSHQWGSDIVNPTGTILADFNQDGRLDILTGQTNIRKASIKSRIYILENQLITKGRRAFVFHLDGKKANSQGLGSMVMLYTEDEGKKNIQRRWYELSQGGIPSQLPPGVHFGVNETTKVLGVKVRWPAKGSKSLFSGKTLEKLYKINDTSNESLQVFTLCESGSIHRGRFSCTN